MTSTPHHGAVLSAGILLGIGLGGFIDGILLQGYFTGGLSFLPLTTDMEYRGPAHDAARVAASRTSSAGSSAAAVPADRPASVPRRPASTCRRRPRCRSARRSRARR